jgi:abequosyltransferase
VKTHLSICIATFNRALYLRDTLSNLQAQVTEGVELVIVDGASVDETLEVVQEFQSQFASLTYIRLPVKGGVDQDYAHAVEHAQGDYVWLFTDDDFLKANAITTVLEAIRHNHSLIILNAEVLDSKIQEVLLSSRLKFSGYHEYEAGLAGQTRLLGDVGDYLSFIGGVIIRRELWAKRNKARYFGTEFVHVGVIFQEPLPGPTLVIADPYISIRYGNAQWTSRSLEIWMFKWPTLIWSFTHLSEIARQSVTSPEPWRRAQALFLFRARGAYSKVEFQRLIKPRLTNTWQCLLMWVIAHLPGCLTNLLASLYASIRRLKPLAIDLRQSPFDYRSCFSRWLLTDARGDKS